MKASLYGHKIKQPGEPPSFRSIVSFIGTCNYNLAKHLGKMLNPYICDDTSCKDTFTFVNEFQCCDIGETSFMAPYHVQSVFTNIPLVETYDIDVNILLEKKFQGKTYKSYFVLPHRKHNFCFVGIITNR